MPSVPYHPELTFDTHGSASGEARRLRLSGDWTIEHAENLEEHVQQFLTRFKSTSAVLDLNDVGRIDTVGALLVERLRRGVADCGQGVRVEGEKDEASDLLNTVKRCETAPKSRQKERSYYTLIADLGENTVGFKNDMVSAASYLGATTIALGRIIINPARFRLTSFVYHMEQVAFRAVPIIMLISFLVGAIVSQQSIFQLRSFGASIFVVDLVGILSLRELGVLLTSIMIAGRSGSAFTAEIGSMKMREEIDALRVMGLDPIEVLVLPRLLALVMGLPLLTFLAEMASLGGGAVVAWAYGGISFDSFVSRLQETLTIESMLVGLIKAPFMGLVVAIIATIEGLQVEGSAESLGRRTTASVVKSIFMVILLDGLFAMFFAGIGW
jgi:phospholipid/cholesterol/gamma-HCH transport system permease protein